MQKTPPTNTDFRGTHFDADEALCCRRRRNAKSKFSMEEEK
jgi:hypothetical protein